MLRILNYRERFIYFGAIVTMLAIITFGFSPRAKGLEVSYLRPVANETTNIQEWTSNTTSSHYTAVDDDVLYPYAGDTSDYLKVPGTGKNGKEKEVLDLTDISSVGSVSAGEVWLYARNMGCNGGGSSNCDQIDVSVLLGSTNLTTVRLTPLATGYGWIGFSVSNFQVFQDQLNNLKLKFARVANGTGNGNNDEIRIATAYVALVHDPAASGGTPADFSSTTATIVSGAPVTGGDSGGLGSDFSFMPATTTVPTASTSTDPGNGGGAPSP